MRSRIATTSALLSIILVTGCSSTGYVANEQSEQSTVTPQQPAPQAQPTPQPSAQPSHQNNCVTDADCSQGMYCVSNTCIRVKQL